MKYLHVLYLLFPFIHCAQDYSVDIEILERYHFEEDYVLEVSTHPQEDETLYYKIYEKDQKQTAAAQEKRVLSSYFDVNTLGIYFFEENSTTKIVLRDIERTGCYILDRGQIRIGHCPENLRYKLLNMRRKLKN